MAAEVLGRPPIAMAELVDELRWPDPPPDLGMVESAGGVRSPLAVDGDSVTLVDQLGPDLVVVVAHAGLGTINDVRLSVGALREGAAAPPVAVFLNRFDPADDLHERNRAWLAEREDLAVTTTVREISRRIRGQSVKESGP
jgi:dethiobiotin synthetase